MSYVPATITLPVMYKQTGVIYSVTMDSHPDTTWDEALSSTVILNKKNKPVYKGVTDGNRIAILTNFLCKNGDARKAHHNGSELRYIPKMDVLISLSSKKVVWENKDNPQRKKIVADCMYDSHAGANHPAHAKQ